jgi:two-component system alkaline phosphatase synthesis response regulator PhoP
MLQARQRVLIVENDPHVLPVLALALREAGYRVSTAQSRGRALAILRRAKVDLIVADSVLNVGNGEAVATGAGTQGIPVILISGDPARIEQLRDGLVPFLAKPFRLREVVDLVKRLIP